MVSEIYCYKDIGKYFGSNGLVWAWSYTFKCSLKSHTAKVHIYITRYFLVQFQTRIQKGYYFRGKMLQSGRIRCVRKIVQDSTNTRDLDKKIVQRPRTQPGYMGKFSIFIVVLIFLFTFQNVNNKIKTTTENLPTQAGCVPGIPTDFLSKSLVFVENGTKLNLTTPSMPDYIILIRIFQLNF